MQSFGWRAPATLVRTTGACRLSLTAGASACSSVAARQQPDLPVVLDRSIRGRGELQVPRMALRSVLSPSFAGAPSCMAISVRAESPAPSTSPVLVDGTLESRWPAVEVARVCRRGGWVVRSAAEECAEESGFRRGSGIVLAGALLGFGHGLHDTVDVCTAASPGRLSAAGARNWITHGGFLLGMPLIVTKQIIPPGVSIRGRCADDHTCTVPVSSRLGFDSH